MPDQDDYVASIRSLTERAREFGKTSLNSPDAESWFQNQQLKAIYDIGATIAAQLYAIQRELREQDHRAQTDRAELRKRLDDQAYRVKLATMDSYEELDPNR